MSGFLVVPNVISDAINKKLEAAYSAMPEEDADKARKEKEEHYTILLGLYNDTGVIPDFTIIKKP